MEGLSQFPNTRTGAGMKEENSPIKEAIEDALHKVLSENGLVKEWVEQVRGRRGGLDSVFHAATKYANDVSRTSFILASKGADVLSDFIIMVGLPRSHSKFKEAVSQLREALLIIISEEKEKASG